MKILYIAHRIPYPPNKGEKIRAFHEIRYLSQENEVHLVAFCDQAEDLQYAPQLRQYCESVELIPMNRSIQKLKALASIAVGQPFSLGYFSDHKMWGAVQRKLSEHRFDLIFVYCSSMAQYAEGSAATPKVLDFVDSDACKWGQYADATRAPLKWLYRYEAQRLEQYEIRMAQYFDACAFVSPRETAHFPAEASRKVTFIQNGVDLDYFASDVQPRNTHNIVFTGAMDYFPNIDAVRFFALEIFPKIKSKIPDARFLIVGSRPAKSVMSLAKIPGVTVTGTVDDIRTYLADARVAVVPLRISQGIQNKILEAFAAGLPVVASPNAAAGLASMPNVPLRVAKDAVTFANSVAEFLLRSPLSEKEVQLCRQDLQDKYNWKTNFAQFGKIVESLTRTVSFVPAESAVLQRSTIGNSW